MFDSDQDEDLGVEVTFAGTAVEHFTFPKGATREEVMAALPPYKPQISPDSEQEWDFDLISNLDTAEFHFGTSNTVVRRTGFQVSFEINSENEEKFREILRDTGDVDEDDLDSADIEDLRLKVFFEFALSNAANKSLAKGYAFVDQDEFRDGIVTFGQIVL
jgi:hypothetical protein